jgi:hypothetical protein
MDSPLSTTAVIIIVVVSSIFGLIWALINYLAIRNITVVSADKSRDTLNTTTPHQAALLLEMGNKIS